MAKVPAKPGDMRRIGKYLGRRFPDLPLADQVAVWRLTDARVLRCREGRVVRWEPPERDSGERTDTDRG